MAGDSLIYNEPITIHRYGELDRQALTRSFLEIVRRHEAWRTTFEWKGDQPVQIVQSAPSDFEIPFVDLRETVAGEREPEAIRLATADALEPFDLAKGPMYRMRLVRLSDSEHRLFITLHHIIFDGVSLYRVLLPELQMLYEAFARNDPISLAPLPIQYSDYAVWQRTLKEMPTEHLSFWRRICHDLPVLDLQTDHSRPTSQTFAGAMETFHIPASTAAALRILSHQQGATPFMTMTAAFMALLHGYTGQEEIAIGGVSSGRHHKETVNLLGCFLNTVVIRCGFSGDLPFTEMLNRVRSATLEALSHDEVPFEMLVQQFASQRDPSRAPLVQALIVVEPPLDPLKEGWAFTHMDVETGTAKFDLQLGLDDRAEGLTGRFIYNTDLFERRTIELLKSRWLKLLDMIARAPTQRISELKREVWREPALNDRELQMPLPEWNGTAAKYPREATIDQVFEDQARQTPSASALIFGEEQLTYDDLNRRANRLARRLRRFGAGRDVPVGVCMERSTEMVVALLAVLKAGSAYVPLDPTYPADRRSFMMTDTGMQVILTDTGNRDAGGAIKHSLCVRTENLNGFDDSNLGEERQAEDLCYIMYTSGSTGAPKGVAVTHRGVVRLVKGTNYATFSGETFLQLAPISFDASTFEIWGALLNGGKLVVMPPAPPSLQEIGDAIREKGVTTLWLTAGLFNAMLDERPQDLRPLRQLLAGGDVLST
ncbi:MAG: condensation domain-containing protein, partial [Verrucomicrobiota bacterium]|nr:condensation domain-containing protein [Verrucomicrobiota bacterium]